MCNFDFDSSPGDFFTTTTVRARKPHTCCECSRAIVPGESYVRVAGKNDGEMWSEDVCVGCRAVGDALLDAQHRECDGHSGFYTGNMWESVREFCVEHLSYDPDGDEESEAA